MPTCPTCQGEYERLACLCPNCKQPLGRGVNLCHKCGAETGGVRLCSRCKSDVSAWERESFPLKQFLMRGGALGLLPSLLVVAFWLFFWIPKGESLHHVGLVVLSILLSQLTIMLLYIKRLFWRERWWASQIYHTKNVPLVIAIGGSFLMGIFFGVLSFAMYKVWVPPFLAWQRLAFGASYVLTYVCLTAALTLVAIHDYVDRLNERVPQPLFVHTQRQLRVVLETALETLNVLNGSALQEQDAGSEHDRRYEVLEVVRLPENGGIQVALREFKRVERPDSSNAMRLRWVESTWRIEADKWARISSIEPVRQRSSDVSPASPPRD